MLTLQKDASNKEGKWSTGSFTMRVPTWAAKGGKEGCSLEISSSIAPLVPVDDRGWE